MGHAFVDGHASADAEYAHSDDQAPEVDLHAVTERMCGVGSAGPTAQSMEEQPAITGVDNGVDTFGDHGRTARHHSRHELDGGDGRVSDDRGDYGLLCFGGHCSKVAKTPVSIGPTGV